MWNNWGSGRPRAFYLLILLGFGSIGANNGGPLPGRLFTRSGQAIKWSVKDPRNRMLLASTVLATTVAFSVDKDVQNYAQTRGLLPEKVSHFGDIYGGYWAQWILLAGIFGEGKLRHRNQSEILSNLEYAGMAIAANGIMTGLIKVAVGRERPNHRGYKSFPSGHTSNAFTVASIAQQLYGRRVGVVAYGAATLVAVSRIHDNKHYLSDVIAGAGLGTIIGRSFGLAYASQLNLDISYRSLNLSVSIPL
ncbi:MAG: phosphatase PAP2 family protein [FCB group bacterium]|nr:phosphatase PAP2 family protein [FCB group bacterium]